MKHHCTTVVCCAFLLSLIASSNLGLAWVATTTASTSSRRGVHHRDARLFTRSPRNQWLLTTKTLPYSAASLDASSRKRATSSSALHLSSASTAAVTTTAAAAAADELVLPRLTADHLQQLRDQNYVVIPHFLPDSLRDQLRADVTTLRAKNHFNVARIGQDSTNQLNTDVRVAETCFLGPRKLKEVPCDARDRLYRVLDQVRIDLQEETATALDAGLTELLYAYYPRGGFYRRHRDAVPGSASTLRRYSLLLYLNENDNNDDDNENDDSWNVDRDGGALRLHLDGGGDERPADVAEPNYVDVTPAGVTLVLMKSDAVPHEVLDTRRERVAVVGWYNRPVAATDAAELLAGDVDPVRLALLGVAAALVTVGVLGLLQ